VIDYDILNADTYKNMKAFIKEFYTLGYDPIGGISVVYDSKGKKEYYQSIIKKRNPRIKNRKYVISSRGY